MDREHRSITLFAVTALFLIFFIPYLPSHAATNSIIINELMYDPDGIDSGYEWIEIKNVSDQEINLLGWTIETAGSSFDTATTLPSYTISPDKIVVIGESEVDEADIVVPFLSMQNGGSATDGVRILNAQYYTVDTVLYDEPNSNLLPSDVADPGESFAPDAPSGSSLARISETDLSGDDFVACDQPTPGRENSFPPTSSFEIPDSIISNIETTFVSSASDPDNNIIGHSWIIENDIYYEKLTGESVTYSFPAPGTYSIQLTVTDSDYLSDTYETSVDVAQNPEDLNSIPIAEAKKLEKGTQITIIGTITLTPNTAISQEGYIQDDSAGIRIRDSIGSQLKQDQTYTVTGTLSSTEGEPKINITSIEQQNHLIHVTPTNISTSDISPEHEGLLITTTLLITSARTPYFYADSNSSGITPTIYLPDDVESKNLQKDAYVTVTGVLSRYGKTEAGLPKLRIIPRSAADFSTPSNTSSLAHTGIPLISAVLLTIALLIIRPPAQLSHRKA